MEQSTTIIEIAKAISKMQGELKSVPKDETNPFYKMRYASIDAIWDTIRKPLSNNGLSLIQSPYEQNEKTYLETMLLHTSGEWFKSQLDIRALKQDPQSVGSALTYARRYSMSAMLGISAESDDDAEIAMNRKEKKEVQSVAKQPEHPNDKPHWCEIHNVAFRKFDKDNKVWYSHKDGDKWCNEAHKEAKVAPAKPQQAEEVITEKPITKTGYSANRM